MSLPGRNTLKRYHAPGIWEDINGDMHFSLPDICEHCGIEPTPENLELCRQALNEVRRRNGVQGKVIYRQNWED